MFQLSNSMLTDEAGVFLVYSMSPIGLQAEGQQMVQDKINQ